MHILVLILTAVGGAIWWWVRNNPRDALDVTKDAATTLRNAPRKFAFRKAANIHPVEGIDDPRIAIAALGQAFVELDDLPRKEVRDALSQSLRHQFKLDLNQLEELQSISSWMVKECQSPTAAITRISRKLYKLDRGQSYETLVDVLGATVLADLTPAQSDALAEIKRKLHA